MTFLAPEAGALPDVKAGSAVAVTATTASSLKAPASSTQYRWAVVVNASPWLLTVLSAAGPVTIQPFYADKVFVTGQGLNYAMSVAPNGSATAPKAGVPTFIQADWYSSGAGEPEGTFPVSLAAQAIVAASTVPLDTTDAADGLIGVPPPATAIYIGVQDSGGDLGGLQSDGVDGGNLKVTLASAPPVIVVGDGPVLAPPVGNPVYIAGKSSSAGGNLTALQTDSAGNVQAVGADAAGLSASHVPVLTAGVDGSGNVRYVPVGGAGVAAPTGIVPVGGVDGSGNLAALGVGSAGTTVPPKALLVAGSDGTNMRALPVQVAGSGSPSTAVQVAGSDGTNLQKLKTATTGDLIVDQGAAGAAAWKVDGSAVTQPENLTQIAGTAVLVNTGATGAGSQRVTVAGDSATVAGSSSLPAGNNTIGGVTQATTPWQVKQSAKTAQKPARVAVSNPTATTTNFGPTSTAVEVLGCSIELDFTTVTLTGQVTFSVQDGNGNRIWEQTILSGQTMDTTANAPNMAEEGVAYTTGGSGFALVVSGTITTLTGQVTVYIEYRS